MAKEVKYLERYKVQADGLNVHNAGGLNVLL